MADLCPGVLEEGIFAMESLAPDAFTGGGFFAGVGKALLVSGVAVAGGGVVITGAGIVS
jgi:hypothetical protein